ncbi:MAG: hypothetical protein PHP62_02170 [Candidatus Moranbacteria bacterium]|nr:hypothetical protein [Candidatus Moranbacteria bacterium]
MLLVGIKNGPIPWAEIPFIIMLDVDMVLKTTIYAPGAPSIEDLADFLDGIYPNTLKNLAEEFLKPVALLAKEAVEFTDEVHRLLANPHAFFNRTDCDYGEDVEAVDELWNSAMEHLFQTPLIADEKPFYSIRALQALFGFGIGRYYDSIITGGFALNEKDIPDFAEQSNDARNEKVTTALVDIEKKKAEILIEIIRKCRTV